MTFNKGDLIEFDTVAGPPWLGIIIRTGRDPMGEPIIIVKWLSRDGIGNSKLAISSSVGGRIRIIAKA